MSNKVYDSAKAALDGVVQDGHTCSWRFWTLWYSRSPYCSFKRNRCQKSDLYFQ